MRSSRIGSGLVPVLMCMLAAGGQCLGRGERSDSSSPEQEASVQRAEGFNRVISAPNQSTAVDYRGSALGYWTAAWWVPAELKKNEMTWETASCPERKPTVFSFVAASASTPPEFAHGPQARLYVNDQYALTFDLGIKQSRTWKGGDFELRYESKRVQWPYDGYHRQFQMNGDSGIYLLSVPAGVIEAGRPCRLKVEILPFPRWPRTWFMVKERKDTWQAEPLAEEVGQLRSDLSRLQELVHILATNQYRVLLGREGFKDQVVYTDGYWHTHPADMAKLRNGDWLLAFRRATEHIARDGDVWTVRSHDEGRTWGEAQAVADTPNLDEREGCMLELPDGRLMMGVMTNGLYDEEGRYFGHEARLTHAHPYVRTYTIFSRDEGKTWSKPAYIDTSKWWFSDVEGPASAPILLPDGTILMVLTAYKDTLKHSAAVVLDSKDGLNWNLRSTVADDPDERWGGFYEGTIVRTRSGKLLVATRNEGAGTGNFIWTATSTDDGRTWSKAKPSPMVGHPPELLALGNGAILCTYGYRPGEGPNRHGDPGGIRAMISYDEGETWDADHEIIVREDLTNLDIGYPMSLERSDGKIATVYYFNLFDHFAIGETVWGLPAIAHVSGRP